MKINKRGKMLNIEDLSLSYSGLKNLDKSVRHYIYSVENPPEQTDAMAFGSAFHCYILEGTEKFNQNFAIAPDCDRRTKEGKETHAAFVAQSVGKTIITKDQYKLLGHLENSVRQHPLASKILDKKGNKFEERFEMNYNKQKFTGVYDIVNTEKMFVADLKTCNSCSIDEITKDIANNKYYWQDLLYKSSLLACDIVNTEMMPEMYFIFVEKTAPFDCVVIQLNDQWVNLAMKEIDALVEKWKRFVNNTYIYSGISDSMVGVECPAYLGKRQGNPGAGKSNDEYQRQALTLKKEVKKDENTKELAPKTAVIEKTKAAVIECATDLRKEHKGHNINDCEGVKNEIEIKETLHENKAEVVDSEEVKIYNVKPENLSAGRATPEKNAWRSNVIADIYKHVLECNLIDPATKQSIPIEKSVKGYAWQNFKLFNVGVKSWEDVNIEMLEDVQLASIKGFFFKQANSK